MWKDRSLTIGKSVSIVERLDKNRELIKKEEQKSKAIRKDRDAR
jgi:hypothetical protein